MKYYSHLALIFTLTLLWANSTLGADKNVLDQFQKLLRAEEAARGKLDEKLVGTLKEMQNLSATKKNKNLEDELEAAETKVEDAKNDILENHLRLDFLNSFTGALENSSSKDLKDGTVKILLDLAHKQIVSSSESGNETNLWVFEIYLSLAIKDIMEPNENLADFVKKYMIYASIRDPRTPTEFLKDRDYISR